MVEYHCSGKSTRVWEEFAEEYIRTKVTRHTNVHTHTHGHTNVHTHTHVRQLVDDKLNVWQVVITLVELS